MAENKQDMQDGERTGKLGEVADQLRRLLSPPLFVGATPSTPFRIATLVNTTLAEHSALFSFCEKPARLLLEKWFAEHPADVMQADARREISIAAMQSQLGTLSFTAKTHILGPALAAIVHTQGTAAAIELFCMWTEALPADEGDKLRERVRRLLPPAEQPSRQQADLSSLAGAPLEPRLAPSSSTSSFASSASDAPASSLPSVTAAFGMAALGSSMSVAPTVARTRAKPLGASPAAGVNMSYAEAKQIVLQRHQRSTIEPLERRINQLLTDVAVLEGNFHPASEEYKNIVMKARTQFAMEKSESNMDRRREQLATHQGNLSKRIHELNKIRRKVAEERLLCDLLVGQVKRDNGARGQLRQNNAEKVEAKRAAYLLQLEIKDKKEKAAQKKRDEEARELRVNDLISFTSAFPDDYEPMKEEDEIEEDDIDHEAAADAIDEAIEEGEHDMFE